MTPDEVIAQAREIADRFLRLAAELERVRAQAALAGELQVEVGDLQRDLQFVLDDNERMLQQHAQDVAEIERLRAGSEAVTTLLDTWSVVRKYADQYPIILVGALDELARVHVEDPS